MLEHECYLTSMPLLVVRASQLPSWHLEHCPSKMNNDHQDGNKILFQSQRAIARKQFIRNSIAKEGHSRQQGTVPIAAVLKLRR